MSTGLTLVVYDATQLARRPRGLGLSWHVGAKLYRAFGPVDAAFGARDWLSALTWLANYRPETPVAEVQYWGHGKWGRALIDGDSLDRRALDARHPLRPRLEALRARLTPDAAIWFRTCETAGARAGRDFITALADFSGARVAGHTFEIAFFQSGLHVLAPGATPDWSESEGLARGTPLAPERSHPSAPHEPNTITCLTTALANAHFQGRRSASSHSK